MQLHDIGRADTASLIVAKFAGLRFPSSLTGKAINNVWSLIYN